MIRYFILGILVSLPLIHAPSGHLRTKLGPYPDGHGVTINVGPRVGDGGPTIPGSSTDERRLVNKLGPFPDGDG